MSLAHFRVGQGPRSLVLLHGFLGAGRNLTTLARKLSERDPSLSIFVLDLTGHGASPPLADDDDLDSMARDVLATADELGLEPPFAIMGHSLGGRVGLAAALRAPDALRKLTLLDISPSPILVRDSDSTLIVSLIASGPREAGTREPFRAHLLEGGVPPALVEWQMLNLVQEGGVYRWRIDATALARLHARVSGVDLWPAVEREGRGYDVHCVRGGRAPYVSDADVARLEAAGARVDTLAGVGHFVHVEGLERLLELVSG